MHTVTIYHNPRCSKSRQTLQLLHDHGIEPEVIDYQKNPLDAQGLKKIIRLLGIKPIDLIRKKEPLYKSLGLADLQADDNALIKAMADHPILIERPIVVKGNKARIGRPPEDVLDII
jgi:arsenate reductase